MLLSTNGCHWQLYFFIAALIAQVAQVVLPMLLEWAEKRDQYVQQY